MNLNYENILARANQFYKEAKIEQYPSYDKEDFEISSDQVKSILKALIEKLNKQP